VDELRDLAVLRAERPLPESVARIETTDSVTPDTRVTVVGVVAVEDSGHDYRYLQATGSWTGGSLRDETVALGRMQCSDVLQGMSGAPACRLDDGAVIGVVSARYNSADGWLRDAVWVARTEYLEHLLSGIAPVEIQRPALGAAVDLLLTVSDHDVRLTGPGGLNAVGAHRGAGPGLISAVDEVRRARAGFSGALRGDAVTGVGVASVALGRAGGLLAESFLPEPVANELTGVLTRAQAQHVPVRIGMEIVPPWTALPWEALADPRGGRALALNPLITLYRKVPAGRPASLGGPLRILVAISAPDSNGSGALDYQRELRNVLDAVRNARGDEAIVRIVPFATVGAIRTALEREPVHVLHLSGHGTPGSIQLEDEHGQARQVSADQFVDEAIPPGHMPAVIALSACHTDVAAAADAPSFASRLCQRGAAAVIATETSITDLYATRVFARIYGRLAESAKPEVAAAVADARRLVQGELAASGNPLEQRVATLDEWAALTVLCAQPALELIDPTAQSPAPHAPRRAVVPGLILRPIGEFVGRRREQRSWPRELLSSGTAGLVLHGIGGIGKTTLAAELSDRILDSDPRRAVASLKGPVSVDTLFAAVASAVHRALAEADLSPRILRVVSHLRAIDRPWQERLEVLRREVLGQVPLLVVLDNFEDNLIPSATSRALSDDTVAALLADWIALPGRSRFLITSRYPFVLPEDAHEGLSFHLLAPLTLPETLHLAWALPSLDRLEPAELDQVWRLVGGHPRSLEYLDALLRNNHARYPDVTTRLRRAVSAQLGQSSLTTWQRSEVSLESALARTVTLAADDVLLTDLLALLAQVPGAEQLLLGVALYREPVDINAVLFQVGIPDPEASNAPVQQAATERIVATLAEAGLKIDESLDFNVLPDPLRAALAEDLAELQQSPTPPYLAPQDLGSQLDTCFNSSLLSLSDRDGSTLAFVHRWTATELQDRWIGTGRQDEVTAAHQHAAEYWQWRAKSWPQARADALHDLLEARHHLLETGDVETASQLAEEVCLQLDTWGAWDQESALARDTLARLPQDSPRRAVWIHQLGNLAYVRGQYAEAERLYRLSLDIFELASDRASIASSYHQLGILAQRKGDYSEAERQYRASLTIEEQLGNQVGMATSYASLSNLAVLANDLELATRWHVQALEIWLRLEVPDAIRSLRALSQFREGLGPETFNRVVATTATTPDQAEAIIALIDDFELRYPQDPPN
jgi:tetratricopeptide (TPR) repeat protein